MDHISGLMVKVPDGESDGQLSAAGGLEKDRVGWR